MSNESNERIAEEIYNDHRHDDDPTWESLSDDDRKAIVASVFHVTELVKKMQGN